MAGATGLEPATYGVTGRHSNQLSYAPAGRDPIVTRRDGGCKQAELSCQARRKRMSHQTEPGLCSRFLDLSRNLPDTAAKPADDIARVSLFHGPGSFRREGFRANRAIALHCRKRVAAVYKRLQIIRVDRKRAVERGDRLFRAVKSLQKAGMIVCRIGSMRIHLSRLGNQLFCIVELAALITNDPKRVQGLEMRRFQA